MIALITGGILAFLAFGLLVWQWVVGCRFPLHRRDSSGTSTPVTVFKPLKGFEPPMEACLRSWFRQKHVASVQLIFVVGEAEDPVCRVIQTLMEQHPEVDAQLTIVEAISGTNAKMTKLAAVQGLAKHDLWVVSDADVWAPKDLLSNVAAPFQRPGVGVVNCFYRLANPQTSAMRWEAVAVNADFWSQVLQSVSLKPMDFALGAVVAVRRSDLESVGGFTAMKDCLADDYQLGNRIANCGRRVELCPVVVECRSGPQQWAEVWQHQKRWARTVRVCEPLPYFFSILSNPTLWPLIWLALCPQAWVAGVMGVLVAIRIALGLDLMRRLEQASPRWSWWWLFPLKDLLQAAVWATAFAGNRVLWRGERLRLAKDGTIRREPIGQPG